MKTNIGKDSINMEVLPSIEEIASAKDLSLKKKSLPLIFLTLEIKKRKTAIKLPIRYFLNCLHPMIGPKF